MTVSVDLASAARDFAEARRASQAGELKPALEAARRAARGDPTNSEAFAIWGVAAAEMGEFAQAVEPLTVAADRAPKGSVGWANLNSQLGRSLIGGFSARSFDRLRALPGMGQAKADLVAGEVETDVFESAQHIDTEQDRGFVDQIPHPEGVQIGEGDRPVR